MRHAWYAPALLFCLVVSACSLRDSAPRDQMQFEVQQAGVKVTSCDFGSSAIGLAGSPVTFTIVNTGSSTLDLSGAQAFALSGPAAADFTLATPLPASIAAGASAPFELTFTPGGAGTRNATVAVSPAGGSYSFGATGTGSSSGSLALFYQVWKHTTIIASGSVSNGMDIAVPQNVIDQAYYVALQVANSASTTLYLTGSPETAFSGNSAAFSLNQIAGAGIGANTITPVPYATIIIGAKGLADQTYTGAYTILSSDASNMTFTFSVTYTYTGP